MDVRVAARVLLVEGHDPHAPDRTFWFTVGGRIEPGETLRAAAVRELREETGIRLPVEHLLGPVWRRRTRFRFESVHYDADEWFFLAVVAGGPVDTAGFTELEARTVAGYRWWSVEDLRRTRATVYPTQLADLLAELTAPGWDGRVRLPGD